MLDDANTVVTAGLMSSLSEQTVSNNCGLLKRDKIYQLQIKATAYSK